MVWLYVKELEILKGLYKSLESQQINIFVSQKQNLTNSIKYVTLV